MTKNKVNSQGFTLIEMAIVLVVIGLILGMVYKGRQLVEQGRVKKLIANRNKIISGINTFFDRYSFLPGDGCQNAQPSDPMDCTATKDGLIEKQQHSTEGKAFWYLLINETSILEEEVRNSVFGQDWIIRLESPPTGGDQVDYLEIEGEPQADPRILCAADRLADDGNSHIGQIVEQDDRTPYDKNTDCWSLSGQVDVQIQIIP